MVTWKNGYVNRTFERFLDSFPQERGRQKDGRGEGLVGRCEYDWKAEVEPWSGGEIKENGRLEKVRFVACEDRVVWWAWLGGGARSCAYGAIVAAAVRVWLTKNVVTNCGLRAVRQDGKIK